VIRLYEISKEFVTGRPALRDVSLHIETGEFVLLTGPSGAGKSTLLKILFGQHAPTSGKGVVNGRNLHRMSRSALAALRRELGLVFQDPRLIERLPVLENIALAAEVCGVARAEALRRGHQLLEMVGLSEHVQTPPALLSGGERQRVSLARALANHPVLLLADEPTGNLDEETSFEIFRLLQAVNEHGTTILMATHDQAITSLLRCRTMYMDRGSVIEESPRLTACL